MLIQVESFYVGPKVSFFGQAHKNILAIDEIEPRVRFRNIAKIANHENINVEKIQNMNKLVAGILRVLEQKKKIVNSGRVIRMQ